MKVAAKFIVALVLALVLVWVIRTYAFTIFSVPAGGLLPGLKGGTRVIVNRMDCDSFSRGDVVVYADSVLVASNGQGKPRLTEACFIGKIEKLPGDTIQLDTLRYVIPTICCKRCGCKDCRYYLVRTSSGGQQLVHKHQMLGKAHKLF